MTIRLTMAQALTRWMAAQKIDVDGRIEPYFAGVWAIFGHGNVAGMGEALAGMEDVLPTYRAHNEQGMAHAAIAFAKQSRRTRAMACTTSIGPGATNMVTAAALAHVNRLPVLFLPGDVYASRRPDPVLQQIEDFVDATVSANDCFRPVSRLFDRITRPEQILDAAPRAMAVLTDPANCGPVTLALCQDVQAEAFDYPESFFAERIWRIRRPGPDAAELDALVEAIRAAKAPLIVAPKPRLPGLPGQPASRSRRRRRGRGRSPGIIRGRWARSASPAPAPPIARRPAPISSSASARGCRISLPARASWFAAGSSRSISPRTMRSSTARKQWWATRWR
jgi:TPP-dependent trihydroxycyclohexane-1,2-dione (THcHDO) dehydratase